MRAPGRFAIVVVTGVSVSAQAGGESIVDRFLAREDAAVVRYVATRRLEANNDRFSVSAWMDVRVELSPETGFTWNVEREGGSRYIRDRVFRKTLAGEQEAVTPAASHLDLPSRGTTTSSLF